MNFMKTFFTTGALAAYWLFLLGGLFILVTLVMPKGILGLFGSLSQKFRKPAASQPAALQPAE